MGRKIWEGVNVRHLMARGALLALVLMLASLLTESRLSAAVASTPNDFKQCAENETSGPVTGLGNCHWIGSIVQSSNSVYTEGMDVPQRTLIYSIAPTAGDVHTFTFSHQATKGSAPLHAYDFLVSYDQAVLDAAKVGITLTLNECGVEIGPPNTLGTTCASLRAGGRTAVNIPDDTFVSVDGPTLTKITAYESQPGYGNRTIGLYGDAAILGTNLTFIHMCGVTPCTSGGLGTTTPDNQDSDIVYTLTYTSTSSAILIEMAGHLAITCPDSTSTCASNAIAWVNPKGSSQINGGPYHFHYLDFDGAGGSQDNQIQGASIIPSPAIATQCYVGGVACTSQTIPLSSGGSVVVTDTVTLTGTSSAISGTVTFWLCKSNTLLPGSVVDCSSGNGTLVPPSPNVGVAVTQGVNGGLPIAKATSTQFTVNSYGAYCFVAQFNTADPIHYGNAHSFVNTAGSPECFIVTQPTAVTVSSFEATNQPAMVADYSTLGLGLAGLLALGAVALFVWRKK